MTQDKDDLQNIVHDAVLLAKKAGADHADALMITSEEISYGQRLGRVEQMEQNRSRKIGLRVIIGNRQAITSSTEINQKTLQALATRALEMANIVPVEPDCLPATPTQIMQEIPAQDILQLHDNQQITMEQLIETGKILEDVALQNKGITNSEGANVSASYSKIAHAISNGFAATLEKSHYGLSVSLIAGAGDKMQTDYDYSVATHFQNLTTPEAIAQEAATRTLAKLNPRKGNSFQGAVMFAPRVGGSMLSYFLSAINGDAIHKGMSFLKERMGTKIFADDINIIEDPLMKQSLGGRLFDGEGLATSKKHWIENGTLNDWVLDLRTARKLNLQSTGNAGRGISSPPSPTISNAYIEAGKLTEAELMQDIKQGFYVTSTMGMGVNLITGDYSQGAEGFWIENGELTYPVQEMTLAGNLSDMFLNLRVADNLEFKQRINVPSLRIDGMIVSGGN